MKELKTLKDIPIPDKAFKYKTSMNSRNMIVTDGANILQALQKYRDELKQEAINWIKEIRSLKSTDTIKFVDSLHPAITDAKYRDFDLHKESMIVWIMTFFNITDKEIQNELN